VEIKRTKIGDRRREKYRGELNYEVYGREGEENDR
jgi:hypothetical protein